ncbi:iron-sulfur protein [Polynucleobacter asymbioticus]|uniref:Iron-sulfur protein n=1 Tax=Polynucleobacter asymbioticus TaxID=576611 RepID=A0AAC9IS62_9BURK|nr:PDR/VanB family oxidoreductase [Polynucleobacter asymbioticus]APB99427.1 iron-sulfur protein [Polynucleobacter asymbioticus]APC01734.1 iron-sulfur protein [Polynucleobacter asymbioticus]
MERDKKVTDNKLLHLKIKQIRQEASGIHSYELVSEDGKALPSFDAGSHIDLHLPSGSIRQYSLSNDPAETHRYVVGILRDEQGRGGSKEVHQALRAGDFLAVSRPRNHFHLDESAKKVILLAGGIGITPLKSMGHRLKSLGIPFELHYCARAQENIAFPQDLQNLSDSGEIQFHLDDGIPGNGLNISEMIEDLESGAHLYYCGPAGFMKACAQAATKRSDIHVNCEHFKAPEKEAGQTEVKSDVSELAIQIQSTGQKITLSRSESLIDVLAKLGVEVSTSCQSGLCGTCKTRYISGDVEHGDCILSDAEHTEYLTPCISHIKSGTLVLDL